MNKINITPDEFKKVIESHFYSKHMVAELYSTMVGSSGGIIHNVRFDGAFNSIRLDIEVSFNGSHEPVISGFRGICPINELATILNELNIAIQSI